MIEKLAMSSVMVNVVFIELWCMNKIYYFHYNRKYGNKNN